MRRPARIASVAAIITLVGILLVGRALLVRRGEVAEAPATARAPKPTPTLYCEFYNFMHNATVVSFLFALDRAPGGGDPRFLEMATVEPDGTRTDFDADLRPQWARGTDDGAATIASPDGATRIVLYGLKPSQPGVFWIEAGVRSDVYKNLDGKCRQANFGATGG